MSFSLFDFNLYGLSFLLFQLKKYMSKDASR